MFEYTIVNHSGSDVQINLGGDRIDAFRFSATNPDGVLQRERTLIRNGGYRSELLRLPGGATYAQRAVLNQWLDFSQEGDYSVQFPWKGENGAWR